MSNLRPGLGETTAKGSNNEQIGPADSKGYGGGHVRRPGRGPLEVQPHTV